MQTKSGWLDQRKAYVTASDVGALLNESPYKTRDQLRMEKIGLADDWTGDENSDICLALEPCVLGIASSRWGWKLHHNTELHGDVACARLAATPDAWMVAPWGRCVVQVKVAQSAAMEDCKPFTAKGAPSTAAYLYGPPIYTKLQVQAEMAVMECDHAVVLTLHRAGPLKLRAYYVPRHEAVIARIRIEVTKFWDEIEKGMPR
jgi:hypothetical protein